jgi:hypothetical protein
MPGDKNDPGPEPTNLEVRVQRHLKEVLKDPYSVRDLEISPPVRASMWTGVVNYGEVQTWSTCVRYNAKNSYGGYVGLRSYRYHFHGSLMWVEAGC